MSDLLPDGIDHLGDCPYTLHQAIVSALRILSYEDFPVDERPPRRIWMDGERLKEHWDKVDKEREERVSATTSDEPEEAEGPPQTNAVELLTRGR